MPSKHKNNAENHAHYRKLLSMCKISTNMINELSNPIDATNRFINLALQHLEEDSQSRQFLLESKSGVRKMTSLYRNLSSFAKKTEKTLVKLQKNLIFNKI